jgi:hypothetical protein
MANPYQFDEYDKRQNAECVVCEELFADALDRMLSPADQAFFDRHLGGCAVCSNGFEQAQRGAAWLSMLKSPQPEPPADLVARILSQTSGVQAAFDVDRNRLAPVIPFTPRPAGRSRFAHFVRVMHEPRLAMTAAMAFFSIALTLNLTGIRLDRIRAASFSPNNLKRSYYEANASAVRYYDNLKVVRVLESRVEDIRQAREDAPESRPAESKPAEPKTKPDAPKSKKDVPPGSSLRETPLPAPHLLRTRFDPAADEPRRPAAQYPMSDSYKKEGGLA